MASRNGTRIIINRSKGPRNRNQLNGRTNSINGNKNGNIQDGTNNTEHSNLVRSRLGNLPSLKEFVHKQSVVSQYRGFLRAVDLIPDEHWRKQARNEIRETFKAFKDEKDAVATKMAVKEVRKIGVACIYGISKVSNDYLINQPPQKCLYFNFSQLNPIL